MWGGESVGVASRTTAGQRIGHWARQQSENKGYFGISALHCAGTCLRGVGQGSRKPRSGEGDLPWSGGTLG